MRRAPHPRLRAAFGVHARRPTKRGADVTARPGANWATGQGPPARTRVATTGSVARCPPGPSQRGYAPAQRPRLCRPARLGTVRTVANVTRNGRVSVAPCARMASPAVLGSERAGGEVVALWLLIWK